MVNVTSEMSQLASSVKLKVFVGKTLRCLESFVDCINEVQQNKRSAKFIAISEKICLKEKLR